MKTTKKELKQLITNNINQLTIELDIYNTVRAALVAKNDKKITKRFSSIVQKALTEKYGSGIFKDEYRDVYYRTEYNMFYLELNVAIPQRDGDMSIMLGHDNEFTIEKFDKHNTCWSFNKKQIENLNNDLKDDTKLNDYIKHFKAFLKAREFFSDSNDINNHFHYDFKREFLGDR